MSKTIDVEGGSPSGWPPEGGGRRKKSSANIPKPPPLVTVAAAVFGLLVILGILMGASGKLGIATIDSQEVAVKVNYMTGDQEVINTPGFRIYIPFVEEVFTFDKRTQNFMMQGTKYVDKNHVPQLTVRASDGSNFLVDDVSIQYMLIPAAAGDVLHDSGPGAAYKDEWIKAHARSILRDEYGRFSAVEVANPNAYNTVPNSATERLNELLEPHGIRITIINSPLPTFDPDYEQAIERRKEADQEVERLKAYVEQLTQEREQRLASVEREKTVEMQTLEGELVKQRREAEADAIRITKSADQFATERRAQGEGLMRERIEEARGLEAKYRKEAEGIASKALALEQRGEVVVREALIEKLLGITFTLVPYSRDAEPKRLEHIDARGGVETMIDESHSGGR